MGKGGQFTYIIGPSSHLAVPFPVLGIDWAVELTTLPRCRALVRSAPCQTTRLSASAWPPKLPWLSLRRLRAPSCYAVTPVSPLPAPSPGLNENEANLIPRDVHQSGRHLPRCPVRPGAHLPLACYRAVSFSSSSSSRTASFPPEV
jgi:hypothetical protein